MELTLIGLLVFLVCILVFVAYLRYAEKMAQLEEDKERQRLREQFIQRRHGTVAAAIAIVKQETRDHRPYMPPPHMRAPFVRNERYKPVTSARRQEDDYDAAFAGLASVLASVANKETP